MAVGEIARGLADAKVFPLTAGDVLGTAVDIPGVRTIEWSEEADSETWEGDNQVIAVANGALSVTGSIAMGKLSLTAVAALRGGTVTTTGTTPNVVSKYDVPISSDIVYFALKGQTPSYDQGGSASRVTIHKAAVNSSSQSYSQNEWNEPSFDFTAIPNTSGKIVTYEQYETSTAIS